MLTGRGQGTHKLRNVEPSWMSHCCLQLWSKWLLCLAPGLTFNSPLWPVISLLRSASLKLSGNNQLLCCQKPGPPTLRQCPRNSLVLGGDGITLHDILIRKLGRASAQGLGLSKQGIPKRGKRKWEKLGEEAWRALLTSPHLSLGSERSG